MKSMLHEASSIAKAIEKAWVESGKPLEFTVNVLEPGEKNFLGFSKKPAIVSITYDPKKQVVRPAGRRDFSANAAKASKPVLVKQRDERRPEVKPRREVFGADRQERQPERARTTLGSVATHPVQPRMPEHDEQWTPELISDIQDTFKEMIQLLNISIPYSVKADRRMLSIMFDQAIAHNPEDQRQLFASLSYLAIQFLKKKHKKKLRGFHIMIDSKRHAAAQ
jgi:predicted RNA-binding protein Jag